MASNIPTDEAMAVDSHNQLEVDNPSQVSATSPKSDIYSGAVVGVTSNSAISIDAEDYDELSNSENESNSKEKHPYIVKMEKYFKFQERGTNWVTEIRGGVITFITMAYILVVNANIVALTGGPCPKTGDEAFFECMDIVRLDLITATASASAVASFIMGAIANLPVGLSAGMGMNAYFTFTVVGPWFEPGKVKYEMACVAVCIEGLIFLTLAVTGARTYIAKAIPKQLQAAITCGIGLFLAMIGMQSAQGIGIVVNDGATSVTLGGCGYHDLTCQSGTGLYCGCAPGTEMEGATTWWGICGFLMIVALMLYNVKGSVMIGIVFVAIMSWFRGTSFTYFPDDPDGNARFDYFKQVVQVHPIEKTAIWHWDFEWEDFGKGDIWVALFTFLYVDLLDTTGTLYAMADFAKMLDENGSFENDKAAFSADAIGTTFGSLLGLSPITSVVESGSGIQEGAKTGVAALIISFCFLLSLFFSPLLSAIPPWSTGPALIVVGTLMLRSIVKIDWSDLRNAFPAFLSIIMMPFTYSIAYGIITGLLTHAVIRLIDGIVALCKKRKGGAKDDADIGGNNEDAGGKPSNDSANENGTESQLINEIAGANTQKPDDLRQQIQDLEEKLNRKDQEIAKLTVALAENQFSD